MLFSDKQAFVWFGFTAFPMREREVQEGNNCSFPQQCWSLAVLWGQKKFPQLSGLKLFQFVCFDENAPLASAYKTWSKRLHLFGLRKLWHISCIRSHIHLSQLFEKLWQSFFSRRFRRTSFFVLSKRIFYLGKDNKLSQRDLSACSDFEWSILLEKQKYQLWNHAGWGLCKKSVILVETVGGFFPSKLPAVALQTSNFHGALLILKSI